MMEDLLIYLGVGHDVLYIIEVIVDMAIIIIGMPTMAFLFLTIKRGWKVPSQIYEQNRQASRLARKVNRQKTLTQDEQKRFDSFMRNGILTYYRTTFSSFKVQLSSRALDETFPSS